MRPILAVVAACALTWMSGCTKIKARDLIREGNTLYHDGQYAEAIEKYDAAAQLDAFATFIAREPFLSALRAQDWARFARAYNGSGYAQNQYDQKLAAAFHRHSQKSIAFKTNNDAPIGRVEPPHRRADQLPRRLVLEREVGGRRQLHRRLEIGRAHV